MTKLQFRVLYREFLFRMVDLELLSAGAQGDVSKLLGQFAALLILFSLLISLGAVGIDSRMPPQALLMVTWGMEHFLITTTMLVVGLFAVLSWDSTFPDRRDVLVLAGRPGQLAAEPLHALLVRVRGHRVEVTAGLARAIGLHRGLDQLTAGLHHVLARAPVPHPEVQRVHGVAGAAQHHQPLGQGLAGGIAVRGRGQPAQGDLSIVVDGEPGQLDQRVPGAAIVRDLLGQRPDRVVGLALRVAGIVAFGGPGPDDLGQPIERGAVVGIFGQTSAKRLLFGAVLGEDGVTATAGRIVLGASPQPTQRWHIAPLGNGYCSVNERPRRPPGAVVNRLDSNA